LQHAELPEGKNKFHFFVEADRGTMSHERIRDKVIPAAAPHEEVRHQAIQDGDDHREEGPRHGTRAMMEPTWLRAYPVIAFEDLTLETLLPTVAALTP
jgi:hypothetical protein